MLVTERHPYYINYLCDELWSESEKSPIASVDHAWNMVVEEERSDLLKDFSSLSENQRKIIVYLSIMVAEICIQMTRLKMDIPVSSISRAISTLEKDYVEKSKKAIDYSSSVKVQQNN